MGLTSPQPTRWLLLSRVTLAAETQPLHCLSRLCAQRPAMSSFLIQELLEQTCLNNRTVAIANVDVGLTLVR